MIRENRGVIMTSLATTRLKGLRLLGAGILSVAFLGLAPQPAGAATVDANTADLNGDGRVNFVDFSAIVGRLFKRAGEEGYREGLDIAPVGAPDGIIDFRDLLQVRRAIRLFSDTSAATRVSGQVFDGFGNPLPGVTVKLGLNSATSTSDDNGYYVFDSLSPGANALTPDLLGEQVISFIGATVAASDDPTPGLLSGQYPTIPNKPIFVNPNTEQSFREMSLPERDLTGAVDLAALGADITPNPDGTTTAVLNAPVEVTNSGVRLSVPTGCEIVFPPGEDPVLSITRVDPARLPVPMPPDLSSSLFITYQPGHTILHCNGTAPGDGELLEEFCETGLCTEFANSDGFPADLAPITVGEAKERAFGPDGDGPIDGEGPFLAGIDNAVFTPMAGCQVSEDEAKLLCGPLPPEFEFAWYHVDILPRVPCNPAANPAQARCICPLTTVQGTVRLDNLDMDPVSGATASVPGRPAVQTDTLGRFSIGNVPAGPNGRNCFTRPFDLRASAFADVSGNGSIEGDEAGVSKLTAAVPGAATDVGDIKLGPNGTIQGRVLKLSRLDPRLEMPLVGANDERAEIFLNTPSFFADTLTDPGGNYNFQQVPAGPFSLSMNFFGDVPLPGGGIMFKEFFEFASGNLEDSQNRTVDFRLTSQGTVKVTVVNDFGNPVPGAEVNILSEAQDFGGGFRHGGADCFGETDSEGMVTFSADTDGDIGGPYFGEGVGLCFGESEGATGVPMGACTVFVGDRGPDGVPNPGSVLAGPDECFINEHGQFVDLGERELPSEAGDIIGARVSSGSFGATPAVVVAVEYDLLPESAEIIVEIDADQDPSTGFSEIGERLPPGFGSTDMGAEWRLRCFLSRFGSDGCQLEDGFGNPVGDPSDFPFSFGDLGAENEAILFISQSLFGGDIGGPFNYAILSVNGVADVVPNAGFLTEDELGSPGFTFDDPLGDTFLPGGVVVFSN